MCGCKEGCEGLIFLPRRTLSCCCGPRTRLGGRNTQILRHGPYGLPRQQDNKTTTNTKQQETTLSNKSNIMGKISRIFRRSVLGRVYDPVAFHRETNLPPSSIPSSSSSSYLLLVFIIVIIESDRLLLIHSYCLWLSRSGKSNDDGKVPL